MRLQKKLRRRLENNGIIKKWNCREFLRKNIIKKSFDGIRRLKCLKRFGNKKENGVYL